MLRLLVYLWCILVSVFSYTQAFAIATPVYETLGLKEGLSDNNINCIYQDQKGFIWIGTQNGLNRYDGQHIITYDIPSLGGSTNSNYILSICQTSHTHLLWIGTTTGLFCFDLEKSQFIILPSPNEIPIHMGAIYDLETNNKGELYVACKRKGVFKISNISIENIENKRLSHESLYIPAKNETIYRLELENSYIWMTSDSSLYAIDLESHKPHTIKTLYASTSPNNYPYFTELKWLAPHQLLLATHDHGLKLYNTHTQKFQSLNIGSNSGAMSSNNVTSIAVDSHGHIWCGNYQDGLNFITISNMFSATNIESFRNDPFDRNSLVDNDIRTLFIDNSGVLWIGTFGNGVVKASILPKYFHYHRLIGNNPDWKGAYGISSLDMEGDSVLWAGSGGSGGGLFRLNIHNNQQTYYSNTTTPALTNTSITNILYDHYGYLWSCTAGSGIDILDTKNHKSINLNRDTKPSIQSSYVFNIVQDHHNDYWFVSGYKGLTRIQWNGSFSSPMEITHYNKSTQELQLSSNIIANLFLDSQNQLWVGYDRGLLDCINLNTLKKESYSIHPLPDNIRSRCNISRIDEDNEGNIWIGTTVGVFAFNPYEKRFTQYLNQDDQPFRSMSLVCDKQGYTWIVSRNTLYRVNPKNKTTKIFSGNYNVNNCKFNQNSSLTFPDGTFLFGTENKGVVWFNPENILPDLSAPQAVLTQFKLFNKNINSGEEYNHRILLEKGMPYTNSITLKYDENSFSIDFSALHYLRQDELKYSYKMESLNKQWHETDSYNAVADFTNIPPGEYTFKVRVSNSDMVWCGKETLLYINITPPWWESTIAYTCYALTFIILSTLITYYLKRKIRLSKEIEEERREHERNFELQQMKVKFFTQISQEFRTPITLLLTPLTQLIQNHKQMSLEERISKYSLMNKTAHNMLQLTNQLISFSSITSHEEKSKLNFGDIKLFLEETIRSFTDLAKEKEVKITTKYQGIDFEGYFIPDKLVKIVSNIIYYALKFSKTGGTITIIAKISDTTLAIVFEDNGEKISTEHQESLFGHHYLKTSKRGCEIGISYTYEMIHTLGGEMILKRSDDQSTLFEITLPIDKESFGTDKSIEYGLSSEQYSYHEVPAKSSIRTHKTGDSILLINSNREESLSLTDLLSRNYQVFSIEHGNEALNLALQKQPSLILCDILLKDINGIEVCEKINEDLLTCNIPIIITGLNYNHKDRCLDAGVDLYITKPYDPSILLRRIEVLIKKAKIRKESLIKHLQGDTSLYQGIKEEQRVFVEKTMEIIYRNFSDSQFHVEDLYTKLGMSKSQFFIKIKEATQLSGIDLIQKVRLEHSQKLLQKKSKSIYEIAYESGYSEPKYFSRTFKKVYGISPSEYRKQKRQD